MPLTERTGTAAAPKRAQPNPYDVRVEEVALFPIPIETRVPLKFGTETLTSVTCVRARVTVRGADGQTAMGWGEIPCSVQWVWPSELAYDRRLRLLINLCERVAESWSGFDRTGHALEIGYDYQRQCLPQLLDDFNQPLEVAWRVPYLAALLCCSPIDIALHDAYGVLHGVPVYETYNPTYLNEDLAYFLHDEGEVDVDFAGKYPSDFLTAPSSTKLDAWHLVGGLDPVKAEELTGAEPEDGYPVLLSDWIRRDGLNCLKVKLRGNDSAWDYARLALISTLR